MLLSGDGKYLLEKNDYDLVLQKGKELYNLLTEKKDSTYAIELGLLYALIKEKGILIEEFRNADLIIPPLKSEPSTMRVILGIQNNP